MTERAIMCAKCRWPKDQCVCPLPGAEAMTCHCLECDHARAHGNPALHSSESGPMHAASPVPNPRPSEFTDHAAAVRHAAETGRATVVRADGSARVVITIPKSDLPDIVYPDNLAARLLALESLVRRQRVSLTALVARIRRNGGFSTTEEQYALRVAELEMGEEV